MALVIKLRQHKKPTIQSSENVIKRNIFNLVYAATKFRLVLLECARRRTAPSLTTDFLTRTDFEIYSKNRDENAELSSISSLTILADGGRVAATRIQERHRFFDMYSGIDLPSTTQEASIDASVCRHRNNMENLCIEENGYSYYLLLLPTP